MLLLLVGGCLEPYAPPAVQNFPDYLVVDGLNFDQSSAQVILTRTKALSDEEDPVAETGAIVRIEDEDGLIYTLNEQEDGVYGQTGLSLDPSKQYRLLINSFNNKEYRSDFTPFTDSPPIDSIYWKYDGKKIDFFVASHDDSGTSRYYRWQYAETWQYRTEMLSHYEANAGEMIKRSFPEDDIRNCWSTAYSTGINIKTTETLSEDIVKGNPVVAVPKGSEKLGIGYSLLVQQQVLTKEAYTFWKSVKETTENLGGLFDPLPWQVSGNIHCITDPDEIVIGYFGGGSITTKRFFMSAKEVPLDAYYRQSFQCKLDSIAGAEAQTYIGPILSPYYNYAGDLRGLFVPNIPENGCRPCGFCMDCRLRGGTTQKPDFWE